MPCLKRPSTLMLFSMTAVASANWTPYWLQEAWGDWGQVNDRIVLKDNFEPCGATFGCNEDDEGKKICGPRPVPIPQEYNYYHDTPRRWNTGLESSYTSRIGTCKSRLLIDEMHELDRKHHKELQQVWAHNGKGVIVGLPVNSVPIGVFAQQQYKVTKRIESKMDNCCRGLQGRFPISVEPVKLIAAAGGIPASCKDNIPMFQIKVENKCEDCGSVMNKGFYLRIRHWEKEDAKGKPVTEQNTDGDEVDRVSFEFRSHKDLPCKSSGTFELFLTDAPGTKTTAKPGDWPKYLEVTLISRERFEYSTLKLEKS